MAWSKGARGSRGHSERPDCSAYLPCSFFLPSFTALCLLHLFSFPFDHLSFLCFSHSYYSSLSFTLFSPVITCHTCPGNSWHSRPGAAAFKRHSYSVGPWLKTLPLKYSLRGRLSCPSGALNTSFLLEIWDLGSYARSLCLTDKPPIKTLNSVSQADLAGQNMAHVLLHLITRGRNTFLPGARERAKEIWEWIFQTPPDGSFPLGSYCNVL